MSNSIEYPVRLSLEQAQAQAQELHRILQESVQPNSSEYKAIINMIERATTQAEKLKQTMGESFKTSAGSKKFNNELQKTFDLLATATGRLKEVSGKNLILSDADIAKANEFNAEIQKIQNEISVIQAGKIGNFFDDEAKEGFKEVQQFAEKLGQDLSNLTFSDLSKKLNKELADSDKKIVDFQKRIAELDKAISNPTAANSNSFIATLSEATKLNTKKTLTPDSLIDVQKRLTNYYNAQKGLLGENNIPNIAKMTTGIEVSKAIDAQKAQIIPHIEKAEKEIEEKIQQYKEALNQLNSLHDTKGRADSRTEAASSIMEQLGVAFEAREKGGNVNKWIETLQNTLNDKLENLEVKSGALDSFRTHLYEELSKVFEGLDVKYASTAGFTKRVNAQIVNMLGADALKDEKISQAIGSATRTTDVAAYFQTLAKAVKEYQQSLSALDGPRAQLIAQEQEEKQNKANLVNASNAVSAAETEQSKTIEELRAKIVELEQKIVDLSTAQQEVNKHKIESNPVISGAQREYEQATNALKNYTNGLANLESKQKALGNIQTAVTRWMGFYQVLNLTKRAIDEMKSHIQELDTVMTQIAVVTNMSQDDLWGQVKQYSETARQYGVAIKGVYEVSQIYYQQGLNTNDVMNLTTETLKMARIAGLDYATAADYMTTAIRGFKLEMTDAAHVTDVYSALAAKTASSTEELAVAISKTASSAEAVGSSFEATSAMMATMIATTRESATNIGTALKSVISRYGEMTSDPKKLVDSEGEEMSLNRVDKALQTVGITIHDVNGQFRDFDDVILELAEKWDTLDKNSQRYIATLMAGNRQQSRFLALVGNVDEYKNALEIAQNAEDTGELQTLKTLDSIDAKIEKMKVTIQEFYTSSGLQDLYKGILDTITNVIDAANDMPKAFGKIPVVALAIGGQLIGTIKSLLTLIINHIQMALTDVRMASLNNLTAMVKDSKAKGEESGNAWVKGFRSKLENLGNGSVKAGITKYVGSIASTVLNTVGSGLTIGAMNDYGKSITANQDRAAGTKGVWGGIASGAGGAISSGISGFAMGGPVGAIIGAIAGFATSGLPAIISGMQMLNVTLARQVELDKKAAEVANQQALKDKGQANDYASALSKLRQLEKAQYDSAEAAAEYKEYMNQLADSYPLLISEIDNVGNKTITIADLENKLAEARAAAAVSTQTALEAEHKTLESQQILYEDAGKTFNGLLASLDSGIEKRFGLVAEQGINAESIFKYMEENHSDIYKRVRSTYSEADLAQQSWQEDAAVKMLREATGLAIGDQASLNLFNGRMAQIFNAYARLQLADENNTEADRLTAQGNNNIQSILKNTIDEIIKANPDFTYEYLTGFSKEDFDEQLSNEDLEKAIELARTRQQQLSNIVSEALNTSQRLINQSKIIVQIRKDIEKGIQVDKTQISNNTKDLISTYTDGIAGLTSGYIESLKTNETPTEDIPESDTILDEFYKWISENANKAAALFENLDYARFNENEFKEYLNKYNVTGNMQKAFIAQYEETYKSGMTELTNAINNSENINNSNPAIRAHLNTIQEIFKKKNIPLEYSRIVLQGIEQINAFAEDGLTVAADNLASVLTILISNIANSSTIDKNIAFGILQSVDFTDYASVQDAIDKFTELGAEYKDITDDLSTVQSLIIRNTTLWAEQLYSGAKDASKEIEEILEQSGKGMNYSSALEEAQKLINAGVEANPQDLIEYSNELGEWVLTDNAIQKTLKKKQETRKKEIDDLVAMNQVMQKIITKDSNGDVSSIFSDEAYKSFIENNNWQGLATQINVDKDLKLTSEQILGLAAELQKISARIYVDGEVDLKALKEVAEAYADIDETFLRNLDKNSALVDIAKMDFAGLVSGSINENVFKAQLKDYLTTLGITLNDEVFNYIFSQILLGNLDLLEANIKSQFNQNFSFSQNVKDSVSEARISKYQTAISEVLNAATAPVSKATATLIGKAGQANKKIGLIAEESIGYAVSFLEEIADAISIEDYNKSAAEILQKSLGKGHEIIDFASGNLDINAFETLANNFNIELSKWFDLNTGEISGVFANVLSYNALTGTFDITGSVEEFIAAISESTGIFIDTTSAEYVQLYSDLINKKINTRKNNLSDSVNVTTKVIEQLENLASAKIGDVLDVSLLSKELQEKLKNVKGISIDDGIAQIGEGFNLKPLLETLVTIKEEGNNRITEEVAKLEDSLLSLISNWATLITNGINGKLTNEGAFNLTQVAQKQLGIDPKDLTFIKTAEGLQLSQKSATELYYKLKEIDSLQASLVFKELNKSLTESNENYQTATNLMNHIVTLQDKINDEKVSGKRKEQYEEELKLAKEILAVRSTTEDSSFDFMSNNIPGGQNNPLNYYNSWQKAIKTIQEGAKVTGKKGKKGYAKGFIDYQDFYNIATELGNLAKLGQPIEIAGITLDGSLEKTAELIEKGAGALETVDTGELKVNLNAVGLDILGGANGLSDNVDKGINQIAHAQVEMLNGMIGVLETVVEMEKLGDISGENNTINLEELFPNFEEGQFNKLTGKAETWANTIIDATGDLRKAVDNIKINGTSLRDLTTQALKVGFKTEKEAQEYTQLVNSLYQMYLSGNYDLNNIFASIQDVFNQNGFTGEFQAGDKVYKFIEGEAFIIVEDKKGQFTVTMPDGTTATGNTSDEAMKAAQQRYAENIAETAVKENQNTTYNRSTRVGQIKISGQPIAFNITDEGIKIDGVPYQTFEEYYKKKWTEEESDLSFEEWKIEVGITVIPKVNSADDLTADQIKKLKDTGIKTFDDLQKAWGNGKLKFKAEYGFELTENALTGTNSDAFNKLLADKQETVKVDINSTVNGEGAECLSALALPGDLDKHINVSVDLKTIDPLLKKLLEFGNGIFNFNTESKSNNQNTGVVEKAANNAAAESKAAANLQEATAQAKYFEEEAKAAREQAAQTKAELEALKVKTSELQSQSEQELTNTINTYNATIAAKEAEILSLQQAASEYQDALNNAQAEIERLSNLNDNNDQALAEQKTAAEAAAQLAQQNLDAVYTQLDHAMEDKANLQGDYNTIVPQLEEAKKAAAEAEARADAEKEAREQAEKTIAQITDESNQKIQEAEARAKKAEADLAAAEAKVKESNDASAQLVAERDAAEARVQEAQAATDEANTKLTAAEQQKKSLENEKAKAEKQIEDLNALLEQNRIGDEKARAEMQGTIDGLNTEITNLNSLLTESETTINSLKTEVDEAKKREEQARADAATEIAAIKEEAEKKLAGVQDELQAAINESITAKAATSDANKTIEDLTAQKYNLEAAYKNLQQQLNDQNNSSEEKEEIAAQLIQVGTQLESVSGQLEEAQVKLLAQQQENQELQTQIDYLLEQNAQLTTALATEQQAKANDAQAKAEASQAAFVENSTPENGDQLEADVQAAYGNAVLAAQATYADQLVEGNSDQDADSSQKQSQAAQDQGRAADIQLEAAEKSLSAAEQERERKSSEEYRYDASRFFHENDSNRGPLPNLTSQDVSDLYRSLAMTASRMEQGEDITGIDQDVIDAVNHDLTYLGKSIGDLAQHYLDKANEFQAQANAESQQPTGEVEVTPKLDSSSADKIQGELNGLEIEGVDVPVTVDDEGTIDATNAKLNTIPSKKPVKVSITGPTSSSINDIRNKITEGLRNISIGIRLMDTEAKGNVAVSTGNVALASGTKTLMGELGPELVVSHGRYFVAGQNGAEFVNLDDDAIVFNHIQTQHLLKNGSAGRGKPKTNERKATSMATGNVSGPAKASASAALAALKQLRAQWQALEKMTVKDLAGKGGGGSGGGGNKNTSAAWIDDVERWYNLMQRIAQLEKDITYQEALRTKLNSDRIANGKAYYESQKESLRMLDEEIIASKELWVSQQEYFNRRREEMNNSAFSKFYTFDEEGQLKYNDNAVLANGQKGGFQALADLVSQDDNGVPKYTPKQQYDLVRAWGFGSSMLYDSEGQKIEADKDNMDEFYVKSVEAFWERVDSDREEMQNLHDSIEDTKKSVLELENSRNELLQEIVDNQISVENQILKAIEEREQRTIDEFSDMKDALADAADKYVNGLNDQLNKERQMYQTNETDSETTRLRRQLAILQRSGASDAQINSLQQQIAQRDQESYFDQQQKQIDAIKEASDLEIERLDAELDVMKESLEYQKEHGLLWEEVYQIMGRSEEEMIEFLTTTNDYQSASIAQQGKQMRGWLNEVEQWTAFRDDETGYRVDMFGETQRVNDAIQGLDQHDWRTNDEAMYELYGEAWHDISDSLKDNFTTILAQTGDPNKAMTTLMDSEGFKAMAQDVRSVKDMSKVGTTVSGSSSSGGSSTKSTTTNKGGTPSSKNDDKQAPKRYEATGIVYNGSVAGSSRATANEAKNSVASIITTSYQRAIDQASSSTEIASLKRRRTNAINAIKVVPKYKEGGLIDFTGPAWVDGTKKKPEGILNAEQLDMLRNSVLTKKNPLMSLLTDHQEVLNETANSTDYNSVDHGINIEKAEVIMNVEKLANDYDARQAGRSALEEMVRIARKTGAQGVTRG